MNKRDIVKCHKILDRSIQRKRRSFPKIDDVIIRPGMNAEETDPIPSPVKGTKSIINN